MSSPPTSNTSIKAAHLHHEHRRSSSFPPFAVLNPFRKKSIPKPARSPSPIEPYEVAPGIWNTDATAKVFGYLEPDAKKEGGERRGGGPEVRGKGRIPKRKPAAEGRSSHVNHETRADFPGDRAPPRPPKIPVSVLHSPKEDPIHRLEEKDGTEIGREKMRTVSRDDQLIQRGANPRTGLVSPLVVSDYSEDNIGLDYISLGKAKLNGSSPKSRTRSGKWRQDGVGWSIVESPLLSPIAQSSVDPMSRRVSCKKLEDKLLVEMPGLDNPEPDNMTDQQMKRYQKSVARACGRAGTVAMVDPNTAPPSPRPSTPEGPSTPPTRLQRIRRKMVGSGPSRKMGSTETVVVGEQRASSVPTPRKDDRAMQNPKILTLTNTPKGSSRAPHSDNSIDLRSDPFLGQRDDLKSGQTSSILHYPRTRTVPQQEAHRLFQSKHQGQSGGTSIEQPATPTLRQYLPRLQLLHPSHFENLRKSSYRRPAQLLPPRLRPMEQQKQIIEDACTTTTTFTSSQTAERNQRPKVERQDGSTAVPRAEKRLQPVPAVPIENPVQRNMPLEQSSSAIKLTVDTSSPKTATPVPADQGQDRAKSENRAKASVAGAKQGARAAMLEDYRRQQSRNDQTKEFASIVPVRQGLSLGNANIIRYPVRDSGTIPILGPHGEGHRGKDWKNSSSEQQKTTKVGPLLQEQYPATRGMPLQYGGAAWFAGHWAENPENQDPTFSGERDLPVRRRSILTKAAGLRFWASAVIEALCNWAKPQYLQHCLRQMACHIARTLDPDSSAMTILRAPNVKLWDYLEASKDLVLAFSYLLMFLNIIVALKKVLVLVAWFVYWVWHPVRIVLAVVKLCVLP